MNKIKTKTSLERQLPEFVREEYTAFVDFVKAYYEFLEQTQSRNLEDIRSIDRTLDEFVDHFRREVASLLPTGGLQNERFFLEKIREFYNIRGSVESYKLLFRLLYNKDVEVFYPSTQILRASDGKWVQEKSVFVRNTSGNTFDLKGQIINITTNKKILNVYSPNVIFYRDDVYEVFIDKQYYNDISIGDVVSFGDSKAEIIPCPAGYKIVNEGSGFEIGAIYNLPTASGKGSTIKITGVGGNGEIKRIQVISFGLDYDTNFYAKLSNKTRQALAFYHPITQYIAGEPRDENLEPKTTYGFPDENPPSSDGISDYIDFGYFINQNYMYFDETYVPINYQVPETPIESDMLETVWYADTTYVGDIIATFYTNEGGVIVDETTAEIKITLGPVAVYPGYYSTNDGFVSDESFIQDGEYYQLFSYTLKVTEQLDSYKDIVKSLLHPSGLKLFGEFNIKADFEVKASPLLAFIRRQFVDYISQVSDQTAKTVSKIPSEIIDLFNEAVVKVVNKEGINSDINSILDTNIAKNISKSLEWNYVPANVDPEDEEAYKQYATISHISNTDVKYISTIYSEILINAILVEAQIKDLNKAIDDDILTAESNIKNISKPIDLYTTISHDSITDIKVFGKNTTDPIVISYDDLLDIAKSAEKIIPSNDSIVSISHSASNFVNNFIGQKSDNMNISDPNTLSWAFSSVEGGSFYQTVTFAENSFSRLVSYNRAIADTQPTSDAGFFLTGSYSRPVTDNLSTINDNVSRPTTYNRSSEEYIQNLIDSAIVSSVSFRSFEDAIDNIETTIQTKAIGKNVSDNTSEELKITEVNVNNVYANLYTSNGPVQPIYAYYSIKFENPPQIGDSIRFNPYATAWFTFKSGQEWKFTNYTVRELTGNDDILIIRVFYDNYDNAYYPDPANRKDYEIRLSINPTNGNVTYYIDPYDLNSQTELDNFIGTDWFNNKIHAEISQKNITASKNDSVTTTEASSKTDTKPFTDSINNQTDTGVLYNNPYNTSAYTLGESNYFSQTYAELTTTNF